MPTKILTPQMSKSDFSSLVMLPIVIDVPGQYITRCNEIATIRAVSTWHDFGCVGRYASGTADAWHKSGRLHFWSLSDNDIMGKLL